MPGTECIIEPKPKTAAPDSPIHRRSHGSSISHTPSRPRLLDYDIEGRLVEMLFALSTILVFTLAVERLVSPDAAGVQALLAASACYSFAWSLFVGVMFVVHAMDQRGNITRFAEAYRIRPDETRALDAIEHEIDATLASLANANMRERLHWQILSNIALLDPHPVRLRLRDLLGGLGTTGVVFLATIPAMIPFLCFSTPWMAVRTSNLITIGLLFACGYHWARRTRTKPVLTAALFAGFGLTAVWISLNIP